MLPVIQRERWDKKPQKPAGRFHRTAPVSTPGHAPSSGVKGNSYFIAGSCLRSAIMVARLLRETHGLTRRRDVTVREGHLLNEILERKLQEKSLLQRAQEANSHVPVP